MKDVCPTEEFEVDVGSDPTIKVAYRPLLRHKESGNKTHVITYTQVKFLSLLVQAVLFLLIHYLIVFGLLRSV